MKLKDLISKKIGFDPASKNQCLAAVKKDGYNIYYINNPSEEVKLEAVKQNGNAIQFIKNPSEKVQLESIKKDPWIIRWIKTPTEKTQLEVVKNSGSYIRYITNPSIEVQKAAIGKDYNINVIAMCPDWEKFEEDIVSNMEIKDIIE